MQELKTNKILENTRKKIQQNRASNREKLQKQSVSREGEGEIGIEREAGSKSD